MMQINAISLFVLLCGALSLAIAVFAWQRRSINGAFWFSLFMLAESVYILGYGLELSSLTLADMLAWNKLEYLGILTFPSFYLLFTLAFTHRERSINAINLISLFTVSAFLYAVKLNDDALRLFYFSVGIDLSGQIPLLAFTRGPLYMISATYQAALLLFGSYLIWRERRYASPLYRKQTAIMLSAVGFLSVVYFLYLLDFRPFPFLENIDFNPFVYTAWGLAIAWAIFRYRLFDLVPFAREKLMETLSEGVLVFDGQFRLVDANPACGGIFGWEQVPYGLPVENVFADGRDSSGDGGVDRGLFETPATIEIRLSREGLQRWFDVTITDLRGGQGDVDGRLLVLHDITPRKDIERQLRDLSLEDELTGLKNRRGFFTLARQMVSMVYRMDLAAALIYLDLDVLKQINDRLGHAEGDRVIAAFARLLQETCRSSDLVARVGGDEFIIFAVETGGNMAENIINRLQELVDRFNQSGQIASRVSFSYGTAACKADNQISLEALIAEADQAMYRQKDMKKRNRPRT